MFLLEFNECLHDAINETFQTKDKAYYNYEFEKFFEVYPYGFVGERRIVLKNDNITEAVITFIDWLRDKLVTYNFPQISKDVIDTEKEYLCLHIKQNKVSKIKENELKEYFTLSFKGRVNSHPKIDYFTNYLLPDLKIKRSAKDFARIALMLYKSKALIQSKRPKTFDSWYKIFCDLVGCEYKASYKPNKLDFNEDFQRKFNYL